MCGVGTAALTRAVGRPVRHRSAGNLITVTEGSCCWPGGPCSPPGLRCSCRPSSGSLRRDGSPRRSLRRRRRSWSAPRRLRHPGARCTRRTRRRPSSPTDDAGVRAAECSPRRPRVAGRRAADDVPRGRRGRLRVRAGRGRIDVHVGATAGRRLERAPPALGRSAARRWLQTCSRSCASRPAEATARRSPPLSGRSPTSPTWSSDPRSAPR